MMLSNNAEPINMFRIDRVSPFKLPSFRLGWGRCVSSFFWSAYRPSLFLVR